MFFQLFFQPIHTHTQPTYRPTHPPTHSSPQGVTSPLAGQMFFRATLFGVFGESKRWLARKNPDGTARPLLISDFYKVMG